VARHKRIELFPPRPDHEHEWEAHERVLASVLDGRAADYVATPITSGRRFLRWYKSEGRTLEADQEAYLTSRRIHVEMPNTLHARRFVDTLRAERRIVIEPTSLHLPHWTQNDYRHLWGRIIQRYVRRVWLLDDWQFSNGCCYEFYEAIRSGVETISETGEFVGREHGIEMIQNAVTAIEELGDDAAFLRLVLAHLHTVTRHVAPLHFKDQSLDELANSQNVAQFVSFGPGPNPEQRYCHIIGVPPNLLFPSPAEAITALFEMAPEGAVNVRSFKPDDPDNHPFKMGLKTVDEAIAQVRMLAQQGLWTIVNESIDINDGGVSGVLADELVEFSPDATPRCVERPGTARLPLANAVRLLGTVYGFHPALIFDRDLRVEFSIHPLCRGVRNEHTIVWEVRGRSGWRRNANHSRPFGIWPNNFSRFVGTSTERIPQATLASKSHF
jgi:hypothetical protein